MSSGRDLVLAQGIAAARAGDKQAARRLLAEAARRDPGSEMAWLWLSGVLDTTQGRSYCLQRALEINPKNEIARRGLQALDEARAARALVVQVTAQGPAGARDATRAFPAPPPATPDARETRQWVGGGGEAVRGWVARGLMAVGAAYRRVRGTGEKRRQLGRDILAQPRFWQVLISCLAVVAFGLVAVLLYSTLGLAAPADGTVAGVAVILVSPSPHGTLRPTFTATTTHTATAPPSPTPSATDTATPTATPTPIPTATPLPTATGTPPPPVRRRATAVPTATPAPRPTLPPRLWDVRLDVLGVRLEPVGISERQKFWRLVEARWADEAQAAGKHSIFVEVLDLQGRRAVGQPVIVQWADGNVALSVEDRPAPDWGVDFGMYNCLGSYSVSVGGAPSDRIVGLGLGTPDRPNFTIHTSFYLVFRLSQR